MIQCDQEGFLIFELSLEGDKNTHSVREFWANKSPEMRTSMTFSKTGVKASGWIMVNTRGETGEAYRVQLTQARVRVWSISCVQWRPSQ